MFFSENAILDSCCSGVKIRWFFTSGIFLALCRSFFFDNNVLNLPSFLALLICDNPQQQAGARLPGLEDIPAGWAAWEKLPVEVNGQLAATLVLMEFFNDDKSGKAFAGDFRNGALDFGWDKQSPEWQRKKRTIELNQGRAAMMGILGLMVHDAMGNVADILPLAK